MTLRRPTRLVRTLALALTVALLMSQTVFAKAPSAPLSSAVVAGNGSPGWRPWLRPGLGFAFLSDRDVLFRAVSASGELGARRGLWGLFGVLELNVWRSTVPGDDVLDGVGVINLGFGGECLFAEGRGRSSLAFGVSVLVEETTVDDSAGSVGVFMDLRPVGVRWQFDDFELGLEPIGLKLIMPAMDGIPLVEVQFATSVSLEFDL